MNPAQRILSACERIRNSDGWQSALKHGTQSDPTLWIGPLLHEIEDAARELPAAPELLWHLENILGHYEQAVKDDPNRPWMSIDSARAVVAKATA